MTTRSEFPLKEPFFTSAVDSSEVLKTDSSGSNRTDLHINPDSRIEQICSKMVALSLLSTPFGRVLPLGKIQLVIKPGAPPTTVFSPTSMLETFLQALPSVPKEQGGDILAKYLRGEIIQSTEMNRDRVTRNFCGRYLKKILESFVREKQLLSPPAEEDAEGWKNWLDRILPKIQSARERIISRNFTGTTDKLVNALSGPILQDLWQTGLSQEAALRTPEKFTGERLELWRRKELDPCKSASKSTPISSPIPGFILKDVEQLDFPRVVVQVSVAHALGMRPTQEDRDIIRKISTPQGELGILAIVDGHGGSNVSEFIKRNLAAVLEKHLRTCDKSLKEMKQSEIENLLSSLFIRMHQEWIKSYVYWHKEYFISELEDEFVIILSQVLRTWQKMETSSDLAKDWMKALNEEERKAMDELISKSLHWVQSQANIRSTSISPTSENKENRDSFLSLRMKIFEDLLIRLDFNGFQANLFGKFLNEREQSFLKRIISYAQAKTITKIESGGGQPGAVVAVALIIDELDGPALWAASVGDSRILAIQDSRVYQLTEDATPNSTRFAEGVMKRGGRVLPYIQENVVHGGKIILNVTRSIGDGIPGITARAKVQRIQLDRPTIVTIGCDGLFETLSSESVGKLAQETPLQASAERLVQQAYRLGSTDNISALVAEIRLK